MNACSRPLDKPFYHENREEWQKINIGRTELYFIFKYFNFLDLGGLSKLRSTREFPALCHILWMLQQPLYIKIPNSLYDFEIALLLPESSSLLGDIFTKLLLPELKRQKLNAGFGLPYKWWNEKLKEEYDNIYNRWNTLRRKAESAMAMESSPDNLTQSEKREFSNLCHRLQLLGESNPFAVSFSLVVFP